jgi:hypothetical protein
VVGTEYEKLTLFITDGGTWYMVHSFMICYDAIRPPRQNLFWYAQLSARLLSSFSSTAIRHPKS